MLISEDQRLFHIQTDALSYIFTAHETGDLVQLYFGPRIHARSSYPDLARAEQRKSTPTRAPGEGRGRPAQPAQPELLKREYADLGHGDFRHPAYRLAQPDGSRITEFTYRGCDLAAGKRRLPHLPSTFDDTDDDAQTLTIHLHDDPTGCDLDLVYGVFPHQNVIVRSALFTNRGGADVSLEAAASLQLDLPGSDLELLQFGGAWSRENHLDRSRLRPGSQRIGSLRGATGHRHNPFIILAEPGTTEDAGRAIGVNLVYSGNFLDEVEVDQFGATRLTVGINPDGFAWRLGPGEQFQTPEAVLSATDDGLGALSRRLGGFYRDHLVSPRFARRPRPILVNNWEATYFDFDADRLAGIAARAKSLGIELFVLDDGWFGHRDDATTSLGDWTADPRKLPDGIGALAASVHWMGLQFGLWFEPEMVSADSDLHRSHPDWVIGAPGRRRTPQRSQYVLDMGRADVVDHLFDAMASMIRQTRLDYVKWDMNRSITEMFGTTLAPDLQPEAFHRYILGVYRLYERLTGEFPDVLFESCASGGGRFDLGMMYYAPQAWVSDDTDAVERMLIQFGTSYGYPQSMTGAHVSDVPNHETGRITPLPTRGDVAFFGDLGYELDITRLDDAEADEIRRQIAAYKSRRGLFQYGDMYRLVSPFEGDRNVMSWQVVSEDRAHAVVGWYQILNRPDPGYARVRLRGLTPDRLYDVSLRGAGPAAAGHAPMYGDELMNAGLFVPQPFDVFDPEHRPADFSSRLFTIDAVGDPTTDSPEKEE